MTQIRQNKCGSFGSGSPTLLFSVRIHVKNLIMQKKSAETTRFVLIHTVELNLWTFRTFYSRNIKVTFDSSYVWQCRPKKKNPECFADDFTDMYCTASGFPPFLSTSRKIVSIDRWQSVVRSYSSHIINKGSMSWDFRPPIFFMIQTHWGNW